MALPSTGWLDTNPDTEEVLPAVLPELFISKYMIGADVFESVLDPVPVATSIRFGNCVVTVDHGIGLDSSGNEQYGLIIKLIRRGAFGSVIADTLTIPEIALSTITKEICPEPFDKVMETCPDVIDDSLSLESKPPNLIDTTESSLAVLSLDSIDLPCGVLMPILFNGLYKFDGSWQFL